MSKYVNRNIANYVYLGFSFYEKDSNFILIKKKNLEETKVGRSLTVG